MTNKLSIIAFVNFHCSFRTLKNKKIKNKDFQWISSKTTNQVIPKIVVFAQLAPLPPLKLNWGSINDHKVQSRVVNNARLRVWEQMALCLEQSRWQTNCFLPTLHEVKVMVGTANVVQYWLLLPHHIWVYWCRDSNFRDVISFVCKMRCLEESIWWCRDNIVVHSGSKCAKIVVSLVIKTGFRPTGLVAAVSRPLTVMKFRIIPTTSITSKLKTLSMHLSMKSLHTSCLQCTFFSDWNSFTFGYKIDFRQIARVSHFIKDLIKNATWTPISTWCASSFGSWSAASLSWSRVKKLGVVALKREVVLVILFISMMIICDTRFTRIS